VVRTHTKPPVPLFAHMAQLGFQVVWQASTAEPRWQLWNQSGG
jgi:hypothetical protein